MRSSKTPKRFCADHNISVPTFYKEIATGRLKSFKIGRSRRISDAAEAEWIERGEMEALVPDSNVSASQAA